MFDKLNHNVIGPLKKICVRQPTLRSKTFESLKLLKKQCSVQEELDNTAKRFVFEGKKTHTQQH